jgi:hypothetical protein
LDLTRSTRSTIRIEARSRSLRRTTKLMGAEISRESRMIHMPFESPSPRGATPE